MLHRQRGVRRDYFLVDHRSVCEQLPRPDTACRFVTAVAGPQDPAMDRLREMTISSHNMVMKQVRTADLKARLSEYLRAVRRCETIAVLDRETPVAQIIPVRGRAVLHVRKPTPGTPTPNRVKVPKAAKLSVDVVQLLLEERQKHR